MSVVASSLIRRHRVHRLDLPAGRRIGDCSCTYDSFDVVAVCLEDVDGHVAWGYEATVSRGSFVRTAPWLKPLPQQRELEAVFRASCWPVLGQLSSESALGTTSTCSPIDALNRATELALWDLKAKRRGVPVWRLLRDDEPHRVPVYGSPLDFPLDDDGAIALCREFLELGCRTLKIKVGAADFDRDIRRLIAVRDAAGPAVSLAVDVNEGWNLASAIDHIRHLDDLGLTLSYIEDPLPRHQIGHWADLRRAVQVPIAGCDYHDQAEELERLLEAQAIDLLRVAGDVGHWRQCAAVSRRHGVPMIFGNTLFDIGVHGAVALGAQRVEYSKLACNNLLVNPPRVREGYYETPMAPGFGWDPCPEMLEMFACPIASEVL